jgi:hypothetical protein
MTTAPDTPVVRFYRGLGIDHRGRTLAEILQWDNDALEEVHDYIQWLFPLDEPSGASRHAPVLTAADISTFRSDATLKETLRRSLVRMLAFYGFELIDKDGAPQVAPARDWEDRAGVWLHPYNHNYLRLTRMMKSLSLLGLAEYAHSLRDALLTESGLIGRDVIGSTTLQYWKNAAG